LPVFAYKGRNRFGEAVQGRIEAVSTDAVAAQLINTGVTPVDIAESRAGGDVVASLRGLLRRDRVRLTDLIFFCRQMYTLTRAGVPIMDALRGLRQTTDNAALAQVVGNVGESLDAGLDLNSALRRQPEVFSNLFVSMVQVGETTGNLEGSFSQLGDYLQREKDTRDRVKAAMRYPILVVAAITIAMFVINLVVIPAFAKVYASFDAQLPWPTRVLIATSEFFLDYWHVLIIVGVAAVAGFRYYIRTEDGRYWWDEHKLRLPVLGKLLYQSSLERFASALAVTVRAGVPLSQGMTVVSRAVDNEFIARRILQMRDGIERGESIGRTAALTGLFPPLVLQMIQVGEQSGAVDSLMEEVGGYYEREVDYSIKNLSAAIEPILITAIGAMVLILALGVFLPMWDLSKVALG
jgi:MSHA biogenesis protein MshG